MWGTARTDANAGAKLSRLQKRLLRNLLAYLEHARRRFVPGDRLLFDTAGQSLDAGEAHARGR